MKLYEALKSGTSAEDLEAAFRKDLEAAQERISKEEETRKRLINLDTCRINLATSIYDYAEALMGEDISSYGSINEIENELKQSEKKLKILFEASKKLENTVNNLKKNESQLSFLREIDDDDVIINSFLKNLK